MTDEQKIVQTLVDECKFIVNFWMDFTDMPAAQKQIVHRKLMVRTERMSFHGFGKVMPKEKRGKK